MTSGLPVIGATTTRVILLTFASALLLAAGDASSTSNNQLGSIQTMGTGDDILAPLSAADMAAASAAFAASLPPENPSDAASTEAFEVAPETTADPAPVARSLSELVNNIGDAEIDDADMRCLATATYFESRGEPLEGQLAVAQAILNRVESGRYANSVCGVVNQRGQFSFDRSRAPAKGRDWRTARAIAQIAIDDLWHSVAPRANSFHAARLSPGWRGKVRVAQIGNHVFYR
jgi:spore germination cell wall hydrolase CwlJ-like protein